jgi:ACR3 family arsenite transporter
VAGVITRTAICFFISRTFFETRFLPWFSPLSLIGLIYTILVMFAYQGHHILQNIRPVFRVFVPLILYFIIMWGTAFWLSYYLGVQKRKMGPKAGYEMAVVQSFTAGSNNFVSGPDRSCNWMANELPMLQELAIAVAIAVYGVNSDQALAATIGPLVEVPVMLALTFLALLLKRKLRWGEEEEQMDEERKQVVG